MVVNSKFAEMAAGFPMGRDNRASAMEIRKQLDITPEAFNARVEEARRWGVPVCFYRGKYYIANTDEELELYRQRQSLIRKLSKEPQIEYR